MKNKYLEDFGEQGDYSEDCGGQGNDTDGMNLQQILATYKAKGCSDIKDILEL